jgi:hypothetical protein
VVKSVWGNYGAPSFVDTTVSRTLCQERNRKDVSPIMRGIVTTRSYLYLSNLVAIECPSRTSFSRSASVLNCRDPSSYHLISIFLPTVISLNPYAIQRLPKRGLKFRNNSKMTLNPSSQVPPSGAGILRKK